ncbi:MAG: glycosyltransferase [Gemmatimonadales bacterium]
MLIVHVLAPGPVGGLERVARALATAQRHSGHDARVLAVLDAGVDDTPFLTALRHDAVPVLPVVLPPRAYRLERQRLADLLVTHRPDVVHTHGYRGDIQGGAVARRLALPTVTTVHGFTGGGWKNRLYERLQRRAFRQFSAVVPVSRLLGAQLAATGIAAERIHVIPNAAPATPASGALDRGTARHTLGLPQGTFVLGWVGRLSLEKGPDLLVEALARTPPGIEAVVIGDGTAAGRLARTAESRGIGPRIHWRGLVPDAGRLFPAFDCFVLSSRTEGTPMVLFEAMATGVPIVATAVGGVPDVVSEREAILVPPEPDALAEAIARVAAEPEAARERAAAARRRLEAERRPEPWIARYDAVYRHVLDPNRSPPPA